MERAIARMVEQTGTIVPLAAQMVELIVDSGASDSEARAAIKIVESLLASLPISYRPPLSAAE